MEGPRAPPLSSQPRALMGAQLSCSHGGFLLASITCKTNNGGGTPVRTFVGMPRRYGFYHQTLMGVALSILEDLPVWKRSGVAIVTQNYRVNAATIGFVLSHKRHVTQNNNKIRKGIARECTPDQTMLQRESQRPFTQQQRPKEEERTTKG